MKLLVQWTSISVKIEIKKVKWTEMKENERNTVTDTQR